MGLLDRMRGRDLSGYRCRPNLHDLRVPPPLFGFGAKDIQGFFGPERPPVSSARCQRIVDIDDAEDPYRNRNLGARESIGVAGPIESLVVRANQRENLL